MNDGGISAHAVAGKGITTEQSRLQDPRSDLGWLGLCELIEGRFIPFEEHDVIRAVTPVRNQVCPPSFRGSGLMQMTAYWTLWNAVFGRGQRFGSIMPAILRRRQLPTPRSNRPALALARSLARLSSQFTNFLLSAILSSRIFRSRLCFCSICSIKLRLLLGKASGGRRREGRRGEERRDEKRREEEPAS